MNQWILDHVFLKHRHVGSWKNGMGVIMRAAMTEYKIEHRFVLKDRTVPVILKQNVSVTR